MEKQLRVLWLIKGLGAGGAERLLLTQAGSRAADIEPMVAITRPDRSHLTAAIEAEGVRVFDLTSGSPRRGAWVRELSRLVRKERVDLIHVHSPALAPAARLIARRFGVPLVYTEHNRWLRYRLPTRLLNAATYWLDTHHFAVSEDVRNTVWRPLRSRVEVLHHGTDLHRVVNPQRVEQLRDELGIAEGAVVVLVAANLRREKAPLDFVRAVSLVPSDLPAKYLWAGQGPLEEEFRAAIERCGVGDRLMYLGYRDDVAELMALSDVFCLSSIHEGLPVAVMEATAHGLPVVATTAGGLPEIVGGPSPCGLLVEPGRPDLLAAALQVMILDPELRERMAKEARAVASRFDATRAIGRIEDVYRQSAPRSCDGADGAARRTR